MFNKIFLVFTGLIFSTIAFAQDATVLAKLLKTKLDKVKDYKAAARLKTDVSFIKVPESNVTVFYKAPDQFKIKKEDGIILMPKGGNAVNLNGLFAGNDYVAVDAGAAELQGQSVRVIKILPSNETYGIVVATLYVDEKALLIRKAVTTTRDQGTFTMEMNYEKYASLGLPTEVKFLFSTKDYKLPKGIAFDYDAGNSKQKTAQTLPQGQGMITIQYLNYQVNQGAGNQF